VLNFFDFETDQSSGTHIPSLVVLQNEAGESWVFRGIGECLYNFCEFIFTAQFKDQIFVSHYGGHFDLYFVAKYLNEKSTIVETIYRDSSIMQMVVPVFNIVFKDSYLFIPTKLSAFPSMFGYEGAKTYFPHLFPYSDYTGSYVDKKFYGCDEMKSDDRAEFIKWYDEKRRQDTQFCYLRDLEVYCQNDVTLLRKACMKFRDMFIEDGHTDPWSEAITLTHACSIVYRKCFMPKETLALIPHMGYSSPKAYSTKGVKWLEYVSHQESIHISHARNDKEQLILDKYYIDGMSTAGGRTVAYEFVGVSRSLYNLIQTLWWGCKWIEIFVGKVVYIYIFWIFLILLYMRIWKYF
jgi:hypothetical protein